jgi:ABC-2 type transport system ATP-binding protein
MIEVKSLVKEYGSIRAVDGISFSVPAGQILGFLGPNGAGKSTTMKMLTGFIQPTDGSATIGGKDIVADSIDVRKQIGYLPESAPSYGEMTVREFLEFIAELRGKRGKMARAEAADKMKSTCSLSEVWERPIETLSKGYKQRVGFAQALIHDPPVLILDEPTDGLDPNQKFEVRRLIKEMGRNKTIILSTHILEEVEAVCERAIIIAQGKIVADASPVRLMEQSSFHNAVTMRFGVADMVERAKSLLSGLGSVARVEDVDRVRSSVRVFAREGRPIVDEVSRVAREQKWSLEEIHVEQGRLDEVFRKVTTHGGAQ